MSLASKSTEIGFVLCLPGYMAGPIVQRLLAMGHTVHGTCRSPENTDTTKHLTALPGADERLKLFKADLMVPGSFDEAMVGCTIAIHTASPYVINVKPQDVRARLIDPALKGTENVLGGLRCETQSCAASVLVFALAVLKHATTRDVGPHPFGCKQSAIAVCVHTNCDSQSNWVELHHGRCSILCSCFLSWCVENCSIWCLDTGYRSGGQSLVGRGLPTFFLLPCRLHTRT